MCDGSAGGRKTTTRSPGFGRSRFLGACPFNSTWPAAISCSTRARDNPNRSARYVSSRPAGSSTTISRCSPSLLIRGSVLLLAPQRDGQENRAESDPDIGHVEDRPAHVAEAEVEKVDHPARRAYPIDEVAQRARGDERYGDQAKAIRRR